MFHRRARRAGWTSAIGGVVAVGAVGVATAGPAREAPSASGIWVAAPQDTVEATSWAIPAIRRRRATPDPAPTERTAEGPPPVVLRVEEAPTVLPPPDPDRPPPVPLSVEDVERILAPLPPLPPGPGAGEPALDRGWTQAGQEDGPSPEPLEVLGVYPSGDVDAAPDITVLFSRAATGLGSGRGPPLALEPRVEGEWRWLDATTARFTPAGGRLPGGRLYTVTVPAGIGAEGGSGLDAEHRAEIRVRGPIALGGGPSLEIVGREAVFLLGFDQEVEPEVVAAAARFRLAPERGSRASDTVAVGARAVAVEEAPTDLVRGAELQPFVSLVALAPAGPLPAGAWMHLELDRALVSAEGPIPTGRPQHLTFRTADAFALVGSSCASPDEACTADGRTSLAFTNPVSPEQPLTERLRVTPEVPDLRIRTDRQGGVSLYGDFRPWTTYEIRIDASLEDIFGDPLGQSATVEAHFERAPPLLSIPGGRLITLHPEDAGRLELAVRGVDRIQIDLLRADPVRWHEWDNWRPEHRPWLADRLQGLALEERIDLAPPDGGDGFSLLDVAVSAALADGRGPLVVHATGVRDASTGANGARARPDTVEAAAWIQSSDLEALITSDSEKLVLLARGGTGAPAAGARVSLPELGRESEAGADGIARLALSPDTAATYAVVEHDGRTVLVPAAPAATRWMNWSAAAGAPAPVWAVTTDRPLYRPGEALAIVGWLRELVGDEVRDLVVPDIDSLRYRISLPTTGSSGVRLHEEVTIAPRPDGGFHLSLDLPSDVPPGMGMVTLEALDETGRPRRGWTHQERFVVREYRRPEYEVTTGVDAELLVQGEPFDAWVEARYFDGPGLPGAATEWTVTAAPGRFFAPGWRGWWTGPSWAGGFAPDDRPRVLLEVRGDTEGRHRVRVALDAFREPFPLYVTASATVQDLDRQAGSATTGAIVHPAALLPAIRMQGSGVAAGGSLRFDVVRIDPEGVPRPAARDELEIRVERVEGRNLMPWREIEVFSSVSPTCRAVEIDDVPAPTRGFQCEATVAEAGTWRITATTRDDRGRLSAAERTVLVVGAPGVPPTGGLPGSLGATTVDATRLDGLELTVDGKEPGEWTTGDTLSIAFTTPFPRAQGLVTLDHGGIRRAIPVELDDGAAEARLSLPLSGAPGPRSVEVLMTSPGGRRIAAESRSFQVGEAERRLEVGIDVPEERVRPGSEVPVVVRVTDPDGTPAAGAGVTLWMVDEAVLFAGAAFDAETIDPWSRFYAGTIEHWSRFPAGRSGIRTRGGLFQHRWRPPAPPGRGQLVARILDGATGGIPREARITVATEEGVVVQVGPDEQGWARAADLPEGELRIVVTRFFASDTLETRIVRREAGEGIDLGTILVPVRVPPQGSVGGRGILLRGGSSVIGYDATGEPTALRLQELVVTGSTATEAEQSEIGFAAPTIDIPSPPNPDQEALLRDDFSPLAGFTPDLVTDQTGTVRATVRLPGTVTRYRVLAAAVEGRGRAGSGEALLVAAQDLVVRAQPPRFLRAGDQAEVALLVQNATDEDREVEVALRARGLELEGSGGVRVRVPARDRTEVRIPARASIPGAADLQMRAATATMDDAVGTVVPIEIPAAPELLTYRTQVESGGSRSVLLSPPVAAHPGWGGVEIHLASTALGSFAAELEQLAAITLPWPWLRIARVRGLAALSRSLKRDPTLGEAIDSAALRRLQRVVEDDMAALAQAIHYLRVDPTLDGLRRGANSLGTPLLQTVYDAFYALLEAERAGLVGDDGLTPIGVPSGVGFQLRRWVTEQVEALEGGGTARLLDVELAWVMHHTSRLSGPLRTRLLTQLASIDIEGLGPVWLARMAALLAAPEGPDGPRYARFLEALEGRAVVSAGGVTFRRGPPIPARQAAIAPDGTGFVASGPAEDAEVLLALMSVDPDHALIPGLVATVVGSHQADGSGPTSALFGPDVVGRSMSALAAWAEVHESEPVDARVRVQVAGATRPPVAVRTGSPPEEAGLPMAALEEADDDRVSLRSEGTGSVYAQVRLRWTPSDPFQPADSRGFAVRRRFEAVDDSSDVRRGGDGVWRIRAGARVRVVHELFLPTRRLDIRLRDPIPGGLEAIQGTSGDEGAARASTDPSVQPVFGAALHPALAGWSWYRGSQHERDAFVAWAPALPAGAYRASYIARATMLGDFIVPGVRAWEASRPDVYGRGEAHRVVIEVR